MRAFLYALPILVLGLLVATYVIAPDFYLEYVLRIESREQQIVEHITHLCGFFATVALGWSALRLWRLRKKADVFFGAVVIGVIALATFVFTGEELSWGQEIFGWETPEWAAEHTPRTNLHNVNTPIRVQTLASLFLVAMFFVLPLSWVLDRDRMLPRSLAPSIAEGPVVFAMAVAFLWRETKTLYRWANPEYEEDPEAHPLYWEFVEQLPEHKEMLVAVALLMYGLYRVRRAKMVAREVSAG